jgi:hypothetical protein
MSLVLRVMEQWECISRELWEENCAEFTRKDGNLIRT